VYAHIPAEGDWQLVLNTDPGIEVGKLLAILRPGAPPLPPERASQPWPRLDGYTKNVADKEVARAPMKSVAVAAPVDPFSITLVEAKGAAALTMSWADKSYSIELKPAK
jgi:hypothetical protein